MKNIFFKVSSFKIVRTYFFVLISTLTFFSVTNLQAQCPVTAIINPSVVVCGDPVSLTAVADGCKPLNNNFNDGTIDASGTQPWGSTNGATVQNGTGAHGCVGPPSEGAYSLWMGTSVAAPRAITTNGYDLTDCAAVSATLCFDMKYGVQAGSSPCEGIDLPEEGISVQYSIGGGAWQTLAYYDPNGGSDPNLISWRRYCLDIPIAALGPNTAFRWFQSQSSGAGFDAWGLDNMVINLNVPGYTFDWAHDAQAPSASPATPNVIVTANSTYTVTYTNGVETCSSNVSVSVIAPTVSASVSPSSVCPGSPVQLLATSSLISNPPSSCGASPLSCDPISTQAQEIQVGSGTVTSQTGNPGIGYLGASNFDGAVRSQFIYRAADLIAAGVKPGKFTSIAFDVASNSAGSKVMNDFTITFMCTSATALTGTAFINVAGGTVVFSPKNVTITTGWQNLNFDQGYNWDGTTNLIVNICWRDYAPGVSANIITRHYATSYVATNTDGTNTSGAQDTYNCSAATGPFGPYSSLPNFKFGQCIARTGTLNYTWTSNPAGLSSTIYNPTHSPSVATSYSVSVNEASRPAACAVTSNTVNVTMLERPTVTISPNPVQICAPATSAILTGTAFNSATTYVPTTFSSTGSSAIPEGNTSCTGTGTATNSITVGGASPMTLATNPVQSVVIAMNPCVNISDYEFYLISPVGVQYLLVDNKGAGGAQTFTLATGSGALPMTNLNGGTYTPGVAFPATGNVNGIWGLKLIDKCQPAPIIAVAQSSLGTLASWSIKFNAPSNISSYTWSPATNLSTTTNATSTTSTASNRTYTLSATASNGCVGQTSINVSVGCALPVELTDFSLNCKEDEIDINWDVASQQENDFFTLEKSFDGDNFDKIAEIDGSGNSSSNTSYNFVDKNNFKTTSNLYPSYYRLSQTDFNGQSEVIAIKTIYNCQSTRNVCINTYPNPVDNFTVSISTSNLKNKSFDLLLHDILGKLVYSQTITPESDNYVLTVHLPENLERGIYLISSKNANDIQFCEQKIIIE